MKVGCKLQPTFIIFKIKKAILMSGPSYLNKITHLLSNSSIVQVIIVSVITFLVYANALNNDFVWDDEFYIYSYPFLKNFSFLSAFLSQDFLYGYYRPLPLISFSIDYWLGDANPGIFHLTNVIIHVTNTVLIVVLARLMSIRRSLSILVCIFYGLHPVLVEPVTWISGRFDLSVTLFMILALMADQIKSFQLRTIMVCILFFLGALCKEMAITFPIILVLWHLTLSQKSTDISIRGFFEYSKNSGNLWIYLSIIITGIFYLLIRHIALSSLHNTNTANLHFDSPLNHLLLIAKAIGLYFSIIIWPFTQLSPLHEEKFPIQTDDYTAWLALVVVSFIIILWLLKIKKYPCLFWLGLAFLVSLFPVIHFFNLSTGNNIIHERFLTFPLVLFSLLLFRSIEEIIRKIDFYKKNNVEVPLKKIIITVPIILISFWFILCAINIRITIPLWETSFRLWSWALQKQPDSDYAKVSLMGIYAYHDLEKAKSLFDSIQKKGIIAWKTLALVITKEHKYQEAFDIYEQIVDKVPRDNSMTTKALHAGIYNNMGMCKIKLNQYEEGRQYLFKALDIYPLSPEPYANMAESYIQEYKFSEAQKFIDKAKQFSSPRLELVLNTLDNLMVQKKQEYAKNKYDALVN